MMSRSPDRPGAVAADARRDGAAARREGVVPDRDEARTVAFFAVAFFAVAFFAVAFFAVTFFAVAFFVVAFFVLAFFVVAFFAGTVHTSLRGSPPRLIDYIPQGRSRQEAAYRHARPLRAER
jgi:uncharacterized membrane protein